MPPPPAPLVSLPLGAGVSVVPFPKEAMQNPGRFTEARLTLLPTVKAGWFVPWRVFLPRRFKLLTELAWIRPDGTWVTIPRGTESDGASVPLIFAAFMPSHLDTLEAGILHDYLCSQCYDLAWADGEFRQALKALGIHPLYAYAMYLALRLASPWRDNNSYSWLTFARKTRRALAVLLGFLG